MRETGPGVWAMGPGARGVFSGPHHRMCPTISRLRSGLHAPCRSRSVKWCLLGMVHADRWPRPPCTYRSPRAPCTLRGGSRPLPALPAGSVGTHDRRRLLWRVLGRTRPGVKGRYVRTQNHTLRFCRFRWCRGRRVGDPRRQVGLVRGCKTAALTPREFFNWLDLGPEAETCCRPRQFDESLRLRGKRGLKTYDHAAS